MRAYVSSSPARICFAARTRILIWPSASTLLAAQLGLHAAEASAEATKRERAYAKRRGCKGPCLQQWLM